MLVDALAEYGCRTIFGIPGGANLPIYHEIADSNMLHILPRHECSAVHMADGFARVSGQPGICLGTSGPGATNMITGLATAYNDSSPLVCLTGQVSTGVIGNDAFQETDTFDLMIPVTKCNFKIHSAEEIPAVVFRAFASAATGRFGPVAIDIPSDTVSCDFKGDAALLPVRMDLHQDLSRMDEAIHLIESAERPVILAGGGAKWSGCSLQLIKLSEMLGAPVVTTVMGKGAVPENHPLVMGTLGMHGRLSSSRIMRDADLVIAVGTRFSDRTTGKMGDFVQGAKIVHIDIDAAEIGKNIKGVVGLTGNCSDVLSEIIGRTGFMRRRDAWRGRAVSLKEFCRCDFDLNDMPLKPQKVIHELSRLLPENAILATDVGQHQMFASHFFEIRGSRRFITSGGLGTMGFGLPAAIGAKLADPSSPVVCLSGDGGFQMTFAEFSTAVENSIPVLVVVMNNSSLGMVRQFQKHFYGNRIFAVDYAKTPDFAKFAEAMGGEGVRVERPSEVAEAIEEGLKCGVPFVADVRVDVDEDCLPMTPPWSGQGSTIFGRCKWRDVTGAIENFD